MTVSPCSLVPWWREDGQPLVTGRRSNNVESLLGTHGTEKASSRVSSSVSPTWSDPCQRGADSRAQYWSVPRTPLAYGIVQSL